MTVTALLKTIRLSPHAPTAEAYTLYHQLDLSIITPRILACSEPIGDSINYKSLYKNSLTDLLAYLENTGKKWMIFNLQHEESNYVDCQVFGNIMHFPWPDHQPPPFKLFIRLIKTIDEYLSMSNDSIVVIHCKAGKGRTGTTICGYLMLHYHITPEKANQWYTAKRMRITSGVSIPSQQRYLKYLAKWLQLNSQQQEKLLEVKLYKIEKIRLGLKSFMKAPSSNILLTIQEYSNGIGNIKNVWNNKEVEFTKIDSENSIIFEIPVNVMINSDVRVLINREDWSNLIINEYCWFWFNSALENSKIITMKYENMDGPRGFKFKGWQWFDCVQIYLS